MCYRLGTVDSQGLVQVHYKGQIEKLYKLFMTQEQLTEQVWTAMRWINDQMIVTAQHKKATE